MGKGERTIQDACLEFLGFHPMVAWVHTTTSGTMKRRGSWIKVGYPGMGDIIGQLRDGRILSVECKTLGKKPDKNQYDFMDMVNRNNGLALWCDSIEMLMEHFDVLVQSRSNQR